MVANMDSPLLQTQMGKLHARLKDSEEKLANPMKEQNLLLNDIGSQVHEGRVQLRAVTGLLTRIASSLPLEWIQNLGSEVQRVMLTVLEVTHATYTVVLDIQGRLPSRLERCLYQEPFVLEDAHGRIKPVYLDCINSWAAFYAWLEVQFSDLLGHRLVEDRLFVLHDAAKNKDIDERRAWETAFMPGQKIVMCMRILGWFNEKLHRCQGAFVIHRMLNISMSNGK